MVNTLSAVFYILHQGAGLGIYDIEEYIEEIFGGERITRSFWFMPQLLFFSIAYLLVFRADRPLIYTVMLIIKYPINRESNIKNSMIIPSDTGYVIREIASPIIVVMMSTSIR